MRPGPRDPHPDAAATLTRWRPLTALVAALLAGPWPELSSWSLVWRVPLIAAALGLAWPALRRWRLPIVVLAVAPLVLDLAVPSRVGAPEVARKLEARVTEVQGLLAQAASADGIHAVLVAGGTEAEPEQPFEALAKAGDELVERVDALVLIDERGAPIAWTGDRPRLPLRLRLLGERAVVAEPAADAMWVWWREPLFDAGRPAGSLLAGAALDAGTGRRVLGVWPGSSGRIVAQLSGGAPVRSPLGTPLVGVSVIGAEPAPWAASGAGAVLVSILLAFSGAVTAAAPLAVATALVVALGTALPKGSAAIVVLVGIAWAVGKLPRSWPARTAAALVAGGAAFGLVRVAGLEGFHLAPGNLLWPGLTTLGVLWAMSALLLRTPAPHRALPWPLVTVGWLVLVAGVWRADPTLLAVGVAAIIILGFGAKRALLAPLVAAAVMLGGHDAIARRALIEATDSVLGRIADVEQPAQTLLAAFPSQALTELSELSPDEQLVVLGRLAGWTGFQFRLPGCSLAVAAADGRIESTWGEVPPAGEPIRVLAQRALPRGARIIVMTPPAPHDVLSALAELPEIGPVAVFSRSGAPIGRGGTFRPLSSDRVGRALAERRGWGRVSVGERSFAAYFRARGDSVVVVPWVRLLPVELCLVLTALLLWSAVPIAVISHSGAFARVWEERRTLVGRLRWLSILVTLVPLLLLGNLLPGQWVRQREQARLELARVVAGPLQLPDWGRDITWVARDLGGVVTVYRGGRMTFSTHPDLVAAGAIPWLAPRLSYVRAVRGWYEPLVGGEAETRVFAPIPADEPTVVAVTGLSQAVPGAGFSPREWFVVTGAVGLLLAIYAADRLGHRLAGPLRELVDAAERLERGEPMPELRSSAEEEVEVLSRSFISMAETVGRREEELRRERDLLNQVLSTLSTGVVVASGPDGKVELANSAARHLLGAELHLAPLERFFGDAFVALCDGARRGTAESATLRPPRSADRLWRVSAVPLAGASTSFLLVLEDLSEVARAERLASLAELARIVAHEVKNPLTPIRLWAEELQAAIARRPQDVVEVARTAAEQILDRVGHLREVAQGFSNLVALERWDARDVDLCAVIASVAAEYAVLASRGIAVETECTGPIASRLDETWITRALRHLVENSIRAIGRGPGWIRMTALRREDQAIVVVSDSGGGVPPENLGRLFEPHFSTTSEGSGLGLAVVHRVVDRAGGSVLARNGADGLVVELTLPCSAESGPEAL